MLHHVRRYLPFVGLSVLLAAVSVASTLLIPVYTGDAVDLILGPGQVDLPGCSGSCGAWAWCWRRALPPSG